MPHYSQPDKAHLGSAAGAGHSTGLRIARVAVVHFVLLGVVCVRTQSTALVLHTHAHTHAHKPHTHTHTHTHTHMRAHAHTHMHTHTHKHTHIHTCNALLLQSK